MPPKRQVFSTRSAQVARSTYIAFKTLQLWFLRKITPTRLQQHKIVFVRKDVTPMYERIFPQLEYSNEKSLSHGIDSY